MKKILLIIMSSAAWAAPTHYASKDDTTNTLYLQNCPGTCAEVPQKNGEVIALDELSWAQVPQTTCTGGSAATPDTPATYDADGNELTPAVPGTPAVDPVCTTAQVWKLQEDAAKQSAKATAKAAKDADDADVAVKMKQVSQGLKVIARFRILNDKKSLTGAQKIALIKDANIKDIQAALLVGNMAAARAFIVSLPVNEPLVTQTDKDTLIALIDSFN